MVYAPAAPPPYGYQQPPPGYESMSEARGPRAPRYSLWVGGRLGLLVYGGGIYGDNNVQGTVESMHSFVTDGLGLEADVGARISRRYIPYLALELGLVGPGSHFQNGASSAGTSFIGVGFRFLAGDVDAVSFASDLSFGFRRLEVTNGGQTWATTAFEFLRIGLGADIRLTDYFTLSPMVTLSGGTFTETTGSVSFADGGGTPDYVNHGQIPGGYQTSYYSLVLGCGAHFDLFGSP